MDGSLQSYFNTSYFVTVCFCRFLSKGQGNSNIAIVLVLLDNTTRPCFELKPFVTMMYRGKVEFLIIQVIENSIMPSGVSTLVQAHRA